MNFRNALAQVVFAAMIGVSAQAHALLVTTEALIPPPTSVVDFSQFSGTVTFGGPVEIGALVGQSITWSTTFGTSVIGDGFSYGLSSNGSWDSGRVGFTGLNTSAGSMTYRFNAGPVGAVGGFINYAPSSGSSVIITALASDNSTLESYDISVLAPIVTPVGDNQGAFRGITRLTNDIAAFEVSNSFIVLDDLRFSSAAAIPEPSTYALMLAGLGFVGFVANRRRKEARAAA